MNRIVVQWLIGLVVCISWLAGGSAVAFQRDAGRNTDLPVVLAQDLPKEAREVLALIKKGGPYPYSKDGSGIL